MSLRGKSGFGWVPEVMVITAAAPVLGSLVNPADPYMLHSPFPWLMLAPLAVALQHGLWAGLLSSAVLSGLAGWQAISAGSVPAPFASWSIGCALTALIAGQIRDSVRGRTDKLAERADHLQDWLERSERSRHLIQLSHAKLEERVVSSRSSLAASIDDAERRMNEGQSMQDLAQVLLEVLAAQGHLHSATLYMAGRDHGLLLSEPAASFGGSGESSARHALVVRAFTTGKLAAIVDQLEAARNDTSVLAAVPLITARRRTVGVVAVHQLPFMMFHEDHLKQVFVLAGHLADLLFDRWSEVHGERQLARTNLESEHVRPTVVVEAFVRPLNDQRDSKALLGENMKVDHATDADGLDISIEIEGEPAATESFSSDYVPASESVNVAAVGQMRATGFAEAKLAADQITSKLVRDRITMSAVYSMRTDEIVVVSGWQVHESIEIAAASAAGEQAPIVSVAEQALESVEPASVVGIFERGSTVARETRVEDVITEPTPCVVLEKLEQTPAAEKVRVAPAPRAGGRTSKRRAKAEALQAETAERSPAPQQTTEALASATAETTTVVAKAATRVIAVPVPAGAFANNTAAQRAHDVASTSVAQTPTAKTVAQQENQSRVNAQSADAAQAREQARAADAATIEASANAEPARKIRTILPPPVENARTAILAAFARKARSESDAVGQARPVIAASFRTRVALSPSLAATEIAAPPRTTETPVALVVAAKAEDARASVRAAFQKARERKPALEKTEAPPVAESDVSPVIGEARRFDPSQPVAASMFVDLGAVSRPSVEEARAALLATLAKARSLSPNARSGNSAGHPATSAVVENAASSSTIPTESIVAPKAPAARTLRHPAAPAPIGFADARSVAQPAAEPRSRTQPLNDAARRSSTSL